METKANYVLISRSKMEERAKKNKQRIHDVGISCGFIKSKFHYIVIRNA